MEVLLWYFIAPSPFGDLWRKVSVFGLVLYYELPPQLRRMSLETQNQNSALVVCNVEVIVWSEL